MEVFMKDGVQIVMPDDDEQSRRNMERAAEFMARMIMKYGKKVPKLRYFVWQARHFRLGCKRRREGVA